MKHKDKLKGRPRVAFDWKAEEYEYVSARFDELCELFDKRWALQERLDRINAAIHRRMERLFAEDGRPEHVWCKDERRWRYTPLREERMWWARKARDAAEREIRRLCALAISEYNVVL